LHLKDVGHRGFRRGVRGARDLTENIGGRLGSGAVTVELSPGPGPGHIGADLGVEPGPVRYGVVSVYDGHLNPAQCFIVGSDTVHAAIAHVNDNRFRHDLWFQLEKLIPSIGIRFPLSTCRMCQKAARSR
jgi:hypothetical protein